MLCRKLLNFANLAKTSPNELQIEGGKLLVSLNMMACVWTAWNGRLQSFANFAREGPIEPKVTGDMLLGVLTTY